MAYLRRLRVSGPRYSNRMLLSVPRVSALPAVREARSVDVVPGAANRRQQANMSSTAPRWRPAYVGVGSNLDSPHDQVLSGIKALNSVPNSVKTAVSSMYLSAPMGPVKQADFVNAVVAMLTLLSPHKLLAELHAIEDGHGRTRDGERWGPRTLDLDLLIFGTEVIEDSVLTVPHSGLAERNFVLFPLCELAPHLIVPGLGSVAALSNAIRESSGRIERISEAST